MDTDPGNHDIRPLAEDPNTESFGRAVHDYYNSFVTVADAKAGAILAANLVIMGGLMSIEINIWPGLLNFTALTSLISLSLSLLVLYPRIPKGKKGQGLIFWEHVKDFETPEEYQKAVSEMEYSQMEMDYAIQNWRVSRVLAKKNRFVRKSIWVLMLTILLIAIMLILQPII